jgi:hypothetical protein
MKKIIFLLIIISAINEGCKKYEEGPWLSLRSAKNRFYGYHTLVKYTVDDIDSLDSYYDSLGLSFRFVHDDDNDANICIMDGARKDGFSGDLFWGWELSNDKKTFIIKGATGGSLGTGPFGINKTPEWDIVKLKRSDIIMKTFYNDKEYLIELIEN